MNWFWQITWQIVPWIVLIPFTILVVLVTRKVWSRIRWRKQLVRDIAVNGPFAVLARIPSSGPIYARSVALSFPDWDGFSGGVEICSGSETVARFEVPNRQKKLWTYLVPPIFKEWRGSMERVINRNLATGELIAKVDGNLRWSANGEHQKRQRETVLRITVFGEALN